MDAVANVLPLNEPFDEHEDVLTEWMDGAAKPEENGPYLRQFDEGEAISWWYENARGTWTASLLVRATFRTRRGKAFA